jgi:uncharacterized membrane protein YhaH (DUF805 family)
MMTKPAFLSFHGRIPQLRYLLWSLAVFFTQHGIAALIFAILHHPLKTDLWFWYMPLQAVAGLRNVQNWVSLVALAVMLVSGWVLASLTFRRCADANVSGWIAAPVVAPLCQIFIIVGLAFVPSRVPAEIVPPESSSAQGGIPAATQGMLGGVALILCAVAISTLGFGVYGYGLFVAMPFLTGALSGFLANRNGDIGAGKTNSVVFGTSLVGGVMLVLFALEGIVCILMASPLGLGAAILGGKLGRRIAGVGERSLKRSLMSVSLLPLLFASELIMPALNVMDTEQTIDIEARPALVWQALLHMDAISSTPALPFRLGVAYPQRAEIIGEGVGALRRGIFSTGVAVERITEWVPDRKLAFLVMSDPPAMHEMSPYKHVYAPHVRGYFTTLSTSFELVPLPGGRTQVVERTSHRLRLDPIFYWMPMARWVVGENNARVLAYIRDHAEAMQRRQTKAI